MRSRPLTVCLAIAAAFSLSVPATALAATPAPSAAATAAAGEQHVIVLLKSQPAAARAGTPAAAARSRVIALAQEPLVRRIKADATRIKPFRTLNAFAASVPAADATALEADPSVAAVIPDSVIRLARTTQQKAAAAPVPLHSVPGACSATPQLDEPIPVLKADSDDPKAVTARSLGYTGKGVKVAWIAEGIDTKNVNFLRDPSDPSSSVFSDYQDFSGDGPDATTDGAEAFLDANAIAGQGKHVYDVNSFSATSDPATCNVRVEGVAPGVSLVGLKVFSNAASTTTSNFLQAIDYAVQTDHVDVLNESFGGNPLPDVTTADVLKQFNDAAVAAGVTVTVSSGDSGPFNTNGSPSTDPKVIAVGASTTFRAYAQTGYAGARNFAPNGWLNDNISGLSSSGVSEDGGTLNVVAPGDIGFASCTASSTYEGCTNFKGEPSDIEESGGTSESAPLTAGAAALVIEAYEKAHGGVRPSPALVKHIITSTATDLGAPAAEQGAGLVDTVKAVQLAASVGAARQGDTLLKSVDEITTAGRPGSPQTVRVGLTNTGTRTQHVRVSSRTVGRDRVVKQGSVTLSDASSAKIVDYAGLPANVEKVVFHVAAHQDRLTAEYAYTSAADAGLSARVRLDLVDPAGRLAAHSIPQGVGNHGFIDVQHPAAGTWTAYLFSRVSASGGTQGRVPYRIATQRSTAFGSVRPSRITLRPGASTVVRETLRTPRAPGDTTGSIVIASDLAGTGTVPVAVRSRLDLASGGRFSGVLTGGNGRTTAGQQEYYAFRVPAGVHDLAANLSLASEPQNAVGLYLVSPHGDAVGYGQNSIGGTAVRSATASAIDPTPGTWTLVVAFASPTAGDLLRIPFQGSVVANGARASAAGLPNSSGTRLPAGRATVVQVRVKNTGKTPAAFFIDARRTGRTLLPLVGLTPTTGVKVPVTDSVPQWFVPSETTRVTAGAAAALPIQFDLGMAVGDPDVTSRGPGTGSLCATTEGATYATRDRTVASGVWFAEPSECGPYAGPAPTTTADFVAVATTRPFDADVTSPTGDVELSATDPGSTVDAVTIAPGATATVPVTITPSSASGTMVRGDLFVDTLQDAVPPYGQVAGDEVTSLPYAYTVG